MGEPLLTHRNVVRRRRNRGLWVFPGEGWTCGSALGQGAGCVLPWRCPVYRWRELVVGAGMEQEHLSSRYREPGRGVLRPVSTGRTLSGDHREGQSTDARHRGG